MNGKLIFSMLALLIIAMLAWPSATNASPVSQTTSTTHVVKRGETLSSIASKYGVSVGAIEAANNLYNPNLIFAGMILRIPASTTSYSPSRSSSTYTSGRSSTSSRSTGSCVGHYTVQSGNTLYRIARHCGVSAWALANANGLTLRSTIYVGQRLVMPGAGGSATTTRTAPPTTYRSSTSGVVPVRLEPGSGVGCSNPYRVRSGDTLAAIAQRCGISVTDLRQWNSLWSDMIWSGQLLKTRQTWPAPTLPTPTPSMIRPRSTPDPPGGRAPLATARPTPMPTPTWTPYIEPTIPP